MDTRRSQFRGFWLSVAFTALLSTITSVVVLGLPTLPAFGVPLAGWTFTGNVYEGLPPSQGAPLPGVTVTLYGSDSAAVWGTQLASANTDAAGAYTLNTTRSFTFYHLVETDPPGMNSTGAQAGSGGAVVNDNWIRYQAPTAGSLAGNHFWDKRPPTPTPTETPSTATATPTYPPKPTYTPTATPGTGTQTPTPTPTGQPPNLADLSVYKMLTAPESGTLQPGVLAEYTVYVSNMGPATAANVVVTDTLPSSLAFDSASAGCTLVTRRPPNDIVRCQLGSLAPGDTPATLTIRARVDANACGRVTNRVEVGSTTPDPVKYNTSTTTVVVTSCQVPGVLVDKRQVDPPGYSADLGATITYAIEITNIGNTALSDMELNESFEMGRLRYVGASPPPDRIDTTSSASAVTWWDLTGPPPTGFGRTLPPGGSFVVYVQARADQGGYGYDCAHVMASAGTSGVSDTDCFGTSIEEPGREFTVSKSLSSPAGGVAFVDQTLTYMVSLENNGSAAVTGIRLRDEYSTAHLIYSHAAYQPDSPANDGVLDWANLTQPEPKGFGQPLQPGNGRGFSVSFTAKAPTPPGQATENCVQAWYWHADQVEHDAGRFCLPLHILSRSEPQIEVSKLVLEPAEGVANPTERVQFTFRVANTGTTVIKNLKVTDTYDTSCLKFLPMGNPGRDPDNTADDGVLDWAHWLGTVTLQPGSAIQVNGAVDFQAKAGACDPTSNTLQVIATDQTGKQATATGSTTLRIPPEPLTPTPTPSATLTPTFTPSPTLTPTPTFTPTFTPTATPTREACCIPLYMPLHLRQAGAAWE